MSRIFRLVSAAFLVSVSPGVTPSQTASQTEPLATADGVVAQLYDLVSSKPGELPDWDAVRSLFLESAVVVLRTSRDSTTVFSLEGFVADFVSFIEKANIVERGFTEEIVRTHSMVFGDIAHVLVLYQASISDSPRPPQQGVDSIQLVRKNGRWWIASIANELPTPNRPVPPELQG